MAEKKDTIKNNKGNSNAKDKRRAYLNKQVTRAKERFAKKDDTSVSTPVKPIRKSIFAMHMYDKEDTFKPNHVSVRDYKEVMRMCRGEKCTFIQQEKYYKFDMFQFFVCDGFYLTPLYYKRGMFCIYMGGELCALLPACMVKGLFDFFSKTDQKFSSNFVKIVTHYDRVFVGGCIEASLELGTLYLNEEPTFNVLLNTARDGLTRAYFIDTVTKKKDCFECDVISNVSVGVGMVTPIVLIGDFEYAAVPFDSIIDIYTFTSRFGTIRNKTIEGKKEPLFVGDNNTEKTETTTDTDKGKEKEKEKEVGSQPPPKIVEKKVEPLDGTFGRGSSNPQQKDLFQ